MIPKNIESGRHIPLPFQGERSLGALRVCVSNSGRLEYMLQFLNDSLLSYT